MKINGAKQTFTYNSSLWSNRQTFNEDSVAMNDVEAKFASYWALPFTELRLGMKSGTTTRWIVISLKATSLYSLIADGKYRSTSIGKTTWRSLLQQSSLQAHCNRVSKQTHGNVLHLSHTMFVKTACRLILYNLLAFVHACTGIIDDAILCRRDLMWKVLIPITGENVLLEPVLDL